MLSIVLGSRLRPAFLFCAVLLAVGCGGSDGTTPNDKPSGESSSGNNPKEKSVAQQYVEKVIALPDSTPEEKEKKYYALTHARLFGVRTEDIDKLLETINPSDYSKMSDAENTILSDLGAAFNAEPHTIAAKIKTTKDSDKTEVEMLRTKELVGDGRVTPMSMGVDDKVTHWLVCLRPNKMTTEQLKKKFGKPQEETTVPTGSVFLLWGRFLAVQPKDSKTAFILRYRGKK